MACGTRWNPLRHPMFGFRVPWNSELVMQMRAVELIGIHCVGQPRFWGAHTHTHTHGRGTLWNPLRRPILALQSPQNSLCCSLGHCCHKVVIPQTRLTLPQQTLWAAQQELPTFGTMVPWLPRRRKTPRVHPAPTNPLGCPTGNCTL